MKRTLKQIFAEIGHFGSDIGANDKGSTHSYIETYDKVLAPYRDGCCMLEIGLAMGDSLQLWDEYFTNSKIVGCDISVVFEPLKYKNNVTILQDDATKEPFLSQIQLWDFDIIIDDGEHTHQSQIASFNLLKHKMKKGGIYIIEDILNPNISLQYLTKIHDNCEVVDLRGVKGRFDDMLLIYRF